MKRLHRILGLTFLLFWLVEALTGVAIEGIWWLDRAMYGEPASSIRPDVVDGSLQSVSADASVVYSAWSAGTVPGQLKIYYRDRRGTDRVRRIGHSGNVVFDVANDLASMEGAWRVLAEAHQSLLAGTFGVWMTLLSAVALTVNLPIGMWMACRSPARLRSLFLWRSVQARLGRAIQAHRLAGAWVVLPALVLAATGAMLAMHNALESLGSRSADASIAAGAIPTGPAAGASVERIIERAVARDPGSTFSALTLPTSESPWYEVRLKTPSDGRAFWGSRVVRMSREGSPLDDEAASSGAAKRDSARLYAIHTGQVGGFWGLAAAMATGLLLAVTAVLGFVLWRCRRGRQPT